MKTLDNKINKVGDELKANFEKGSKMSIISSYFSIYAFTVLPSKDDTTLGLKVHPFVISFEAVIVTTASVDVVYAFITIGTSDVFLKVKSL